MTWWSNIFVKHCIYKVVMMRLTIPDTNITDTTKHKKSKTFPSKQLVIKYLKSTETAPSLYTM